MSVAILAPREPNAQEGDYQHYLMSSNLKIYKGSLVCLRTDGYAYLARSGTSTDVFVGVADETVDNTTGANLNGNGGAAGGGSIRVRKRGTFTFVASFGAVQGDTGQAVYASDELTVTKTSTNNQLVGYIQNVPNNNNVRIRINRAVQ